MFTYDTIYCRAQFFFFLSSLFFSFLFLNCYIEGLFVDFAGFFSWKKKEGGTYMYDTFLQ